MKKKKAAQRQERDLPRPGKQYPGVHGKIVDFAREMVRHCTRMYFGKTCFTRSSTGFALRVL